MESLNQPYIASPSCSLKKNAKYTITIITATRAEWGLLSPLAHRIHNDPNIDLHIIATGAHLSAEFGNTYEEILHNGLHITEKIPILESQNTPLSIAMATANAISRFSSYFNATNTDMVIILGDRYEMFGVAYACANLKIPIAHICGGESTQGANDEYIRHCITKMSYLHFATTNVYRQRIIQLGEEPHRVFNVGSLAVENILRTSFFTSKELALFLDVDEDFLKSFCVLTYHPATLEHISEREQITLICESLLSSPYNIVATKSNADAQGALINEVLHSYSIKYPTRFILRSSLGKRGYLSSLKLAQFIIGNSSSALSEGLIMRIPSINIGTRQKGRIKNACVIDCHPTSIELKKAIAQVNKKEFLASIHNLPHLFGEGNTSYLILQHLKAFLAQGQVELKKPFFDIDFPACL